MKRRITLSIALVVSVVLVSLMSSDSTAKAQNQTRSVWDTGVITLGANQTLRVTVVQTGSGTDNTRVSFRKMQYSTGTCNADGVCKHSTATASDYETNLVAGEAASVVMEFPGNTFAGVRAMVSSNSRNMKVNVLIIDTITGEVLSYGDVIVGGHY
jgi:signal recognition particle receptor subunit beta